MKRKHLVIGLACLAVAVVLFFVFGNSSRRTSDDASGGEKEKLSRLHSLFQFMDSDNESRPVQEFHPDNVKTYQIEKANLIRDVIIEKNPVCVNEDFMVRVIAKNPNGPDEHLVYRIQNKLGNPAILRYTRAGLKEFYVVVRDEGMHIDFKKVQVNVLDCPGRNAVILRGRLHNLKSETAQFEVTSQEGLAGKCTYLWDFGDKKKATTSTGYVEHSYATREQRTLQSSFLVTVKVIDSLHQTAIGRTTISFPNIHYLSRLMGSAVLPVVYDQFPKVTDNGIEVTAVFKNIFDEPVTFNIAEIELKPCIASGSPDRRELPASSVIGVSTISPGATVEQVVHVSNSVVASSTCNVSISLKGAFPGNEVGYAKLYLSIPPRSRDNVDFNKDKVIEDDDMVRKLNRAAQILGKDRPITPADIEKLDREGKL
ncbi:MAG: PKD domain-containing protein [Spirochaetes bacterium]|nr:PKD domain-containing protein [Spirochaetota bacterium]